MNRPGISNQITWVYTTDLEQTSDFYEKDLGFKLVLDEGAARIFQITFAAQIGVCTAFEDRVVEPRGGMITLVSNEVDEWYAQLMNKGVTIHKPPQVVEKFNIYSFFVEDPNGYVIEIQQFLD